MKAREYEILSRAVEEGVQYGWQRVKYGLGPEAADEIKSEIYEAAMAAVCDVFTFSGKDEDA